MRKSGKALRGETLHEDHRDVRLRTELFALIPHEIDRIRAARAGQPLPPRKVTSETNMYLLSGFLFLALASGSVFAAPFIVSDPLDPRATHCGFQIDEAARKDVPVATTGTTNTSKICRYDAGTLTDGPHTVTATAVAIDPLWGRLESVPSAPLAVTKPSVPGVPTGFKLVP